MFQSTKYDLRTFYQWLDIIEGWLDDSFDNSNKALVWFIFNGRLHEKTNNLGYRPGPTQTRLYSCRKKLEG